MNFIQFLKESVPYAWKKGILDAIQPNRQGIGPVLRGMQRDKTVVFDVGANDGDVSLMMLHYFPRATVYSFEPCSETYDILEKKIASQPKYSDRSRPFRLGFFDQETEGILNITSFHGANSLLDISEEYGRMHPHIQRLKTERIPLVRLDDFVAQHDIKHIDLVKIDVEGVEKQILLGGPQTFANKVDTVIMEISFVRNPRESGEFIKLFQLMHDYGFAPAEIFDVGHAEGNDGWKLLQLDCVFRKF